MSLVSTPVARRARARARRPARTARARHHRPVVILVDRSKRAALEIPRARAREREERNERERRRPAHRARVHPRRPNAVRRAVVVREDTRAPSVSPSLRARAMVISDETYGRWKSPCPSCTIGSRTRARRGRRCARVGEKPSIECVSNEAARLSHRADGGNEHGGEAAAEHDLGVSGGGAATARGGDGAHDF